MCVPAYMPMLAVCVCVCWLRKRLEEKYRCADLLCDGSPLRGCVISEKVHADSIASLAAGQPPPPPAFRVTSTSPDTVSALTSTCHYGKT